MAANSYYDSHPLLAEQQHQHLLSPALSSPGYPPGPSSGQSTPLRPLHSPSAMQTPDKHEYRHSLVDFDGLRDAHEKDAALKARIRRLRVLSRVIACALSIAVFVPIAMTVYKFLTTKDVFHDVLHPDGTRQRRTAWAANTKSWPTWMYFIIAAVSLVLNLIIIFAYQCGVSAANKAATISTIFTWLVMIGHLVVWFVAASLYRTEKDKNGKSNDLWGWTCSPAAQKIQKEFAHEVDFNKYCNVQSISWYLGLVQAGSAILTVITYGYVLMRQRGKKELKKRRHSQMRGQYPTNY